MYLVVELLVEDSDHWQDGGEDSWSRQAWAVLAVELQLPSWPLFVGAVGNCGNETPARNVACCRLKKLVGSLETSLPAR